MHFSRGHKKNKALKTYEALLHVHRSALSSARPEDEAMRSILHRTSSPLQGRAAAAAAATVRVGGIKRFFHEPLNRLGLTGRDVGGENLRVAALDRLK